jgi:hypothetical protein
MRSLSTLVRPVFDPPGDGYAQHVRAPAVQGVKSTPAS